MEISSRVVLERPALAAGAAGTVFRGILCSTGERVVVKLNRRGVEQPRELNGVTMAVCDKQQELEAMRRLREVPSVAQLLGTVALELLSFGNSSEKPEEGEFESPGLVLEYVEGQTLRSYLHSKQFWSRFVTDANSLVLEFNCLMLQCLLSVADMDEVGVVHADWHFRNIMVSSQHSVLLQDRQFPVIKTIDFGIVRLDVSDDHAIQHFARKLHRVDQVARDLSLVPKLLAAKNKKPVAESTTSLHSLIPESVRFLEHMASDYASLMPFPQTRQAVFKFLHADAVKTLGPALLQTAVWTRCFLDAVARAFAIDPHLLL